MRLCWLSRDGPQSISLLMDLIKVSHFDHGKSCSKTAELLKKFATKYHLENHQYQSSVVADYQIAGYIKRHLIEEDLETLAERLGICNSHNQQNFFKRMLEQILLAVTRNECDCKFLNHFLIENNSYFSSMVPTSRCGKNIQ